MDDKVIAVTGATGAQGGSLARAILKDRASGFSVRALTRDPESPVAQELARLGADVVRADFYDERSVHQAFEGAYGAFLVTNFFAHGSAAREAEEINVLVCAAAATKLRHVIWSTLEDTREFLPLDDDRMPVLQGSYNVPHFDAKGESNEALRQASVPTTFLNTTFYFQNFANFFAPQRGEDGVLTLSLPIRDTTLLSAVDVEDVGRTALAIFKGGSRFIGESVSLAGDHLTGEQYADKLAIVLGEPVRWQSIPFEAYRALDFPGAQDIANMFQFYSDFDRELTGARDLDWLRGLNPDLRGFDSWLAENKERFAAG